MCGLAVLITRGTMPDLHALRPALDALAHRGPDADVAIHQTFGTDTAAVHVMLGHRRLAILDLDARSNQPFTRDGHSLVYNGEIYNFRALAAMLRMEGDTFETSGDTEVLLRLLMRHGVNGLGEANGMWAFCWLDRRRRRLIACRDRYGKKPLFYALSDDRISLASEIGALLPLARLRPHAASGAIESFLSEGWLYPNPDGSTHIAGIREVRPGHCLEIDLDSWTFTETPCCVLAPPDDAWPEGKLADIVADAVGARLVSDRKVGLLLSGGVDSSLILSILAKRGWLDQVICVTGDAGKSDDAHYARLCLDAVGRKAVELPMDYGGAGFDQFLAICGAQEKPFPLIGNVLGMWALYKALGQEGVRVALDGTGADEIFGGYWKRYAGFALRDAARAGDAGWLARLRAGGVVPEAFLALSHAQWMRGEGVAPEKDALGAREQSFLKDTVAGTIDTARLSDPLIGFTGTLGEALFLDASAGRMQEWLWQNDRNAMAASIENRSPFLDWRLASFMAAPYSQKFDGAFNKRALRALFDVFTPLPTATRTDKQGFRWVFGRFMRQNRTQILDLIGASPLAARFVDCGRLLRLAAEDDSMLESRLMQRLMVIAGLEAVGKLAA